MLYLTCTTITSIDLAHYGVSRAKDWVSVKCGTMLLGRFLFKDHTCARSRKKKKNAIYAFTTCLVFVSVLRYFERSLVKYR